MDATTRKDYLGGSDIAAILGLSPWATRDDLLREKITGESQRFYSSAMQFGHRVESTLIDSDAFLNDYKVLPPEAGQEQHEITGEIDGFTIKCHLDGIGEKDGKKFLIEVKTSSAPFNGELPDYYACQIMFYMHWANLDECRVVFGQRMADGTLGNQESFIVKQQAGWYEIVLPEIKQFIADIRKGEVPPKYLPAPIEQTQIAEYINICQIYEQAQTFMEKFRETLADKMAESGIKKCYLGGFVASLTADSEFTAFDSAKFKKENPEIAAKYEKTTKRKGGLRIAKTNKGE